jgi:hypothetical protein
VPAVVPGHTFALEIGDLFDVRLVAHGLAYYLYLVISSRLELMACVLYRLGVFR